MRLLIKKMLPFDFATDEDFRILVGSMSEYFPRLSPRRVRHVIVEMYAATKKVRLSIASTRDNYC